MDHLHAAAVDSLQTAAMDRHEAPAMDRSRSHLRVQVASAWLVPNAHERQHRFHGFLDKRAGYQQLCSECDSWDLSPCEAAAKAWSRRRRETHRRFRCIRSECAAAFSGVSGLQIYLRAKHSAAAGLEHKCCIDFCDWRAKTWSHQDSFWQRPKRILRVKARSTRETSPYKYARKVLAPTPLYFGQEVSNVGRTGQRVRQLTQPLPDRTTAVQKRLWAQTSSTH